jgi:hypothetical protein
MMAIINRGIKTKTFHIISKKKKIGLFTIATEIIDMCFKT